MAHNQHHDMSRDLPYLAVPVADLVPYENGLGMFKAVDSNPGLFVIVGSEFSEVVEIAIPPGITISAEPGTMVHMSRYLRPYVDIGDCCQGCKRCCCAGESCCRLNFKNNTKDHQLLALTGNFPGRIIPINLAKFPHGIFFRAGAFLAGVGTDWRIHLQVTNCCTGCCGGMGFVLNKLTGSGYGFLAAGGTIMQKELQEGESIIVDQNSLVGFESTVKFSVKRSGGCCVMCCADMGLYNAKLTGPGLIFMESMSPKKLIYGLVRVQNGKT